jgi:hypothetical protein
LRDGTESDDVQSLPEKQGIGNREQATGKPAYSV